MSGNNHPVRRFLRQYRDREGTLELAHRASNRVEQILSGGEVGVHQVRDHFRVRVGVKDVSGFNQPCAYALVVFDNSVVDEGEAIVADVRMRVSLTGRAMSCPAGVGDAQLSGDVALLCHFRQTANPADAAQAVQTIIEYRKASRIISAIFEFAQSFQQHRNNVARGYRPYDSTHGKNAF